MSEAGQARSHGRSRQASGPSLTSTKPAPEASQALLTRSPGSRGRSLRTGRASWWAGPSRREAPGALEQRPGDLLEVGGLRPHSSIRAPCVDPALSHPTAAPEPAAPRQTARSGRSTVPRPALASPLEALQHLPSSWEVFASPYPTLRS